MRAREGIELETEGLKQRVSTGSRMSDLEDMKDKA